MLTIADIATLCNAFCGVLSMFFSIAGNFRWAAIFLLIAVFWDFIDGKVARLFHSEGMLGRDLDSLSDVVSFGVAPAIFGFCYGLDSAWEILGLIFFVSCGILRLARFNVLKLNYFIGVPITTNGLWLPLAFWTGALAEPWAVMLFIFGGFLMISSLRIGKIL